VLACAVSAGSVSADSVSASSESAGAVPAGLVLARALRPCSLVVLYPVVGPGAAAGSRSAVLAGHSPPGPGPDDGSAAPQRCPEPDTSIRPGDRELAIFAGAPERSGSDLCRGQDASGCGRDILCSLPGAAVLMTASLATVPRRGARSGPLTRPDAGLDRRSLNAGSRVGQALNRQLPVRQVAHRAAGRRSGGRIDVLPRIFLPHCILLHARPSETVQQRPEHGDQDPAGGQRR
jgi:hypothetical protein